MKKGLVFTIAIAAILLVWGVSTYNGLVTASVAIDTEWKQVEVQYQRRFDLIPNLVEQAKGVMKQEEAIFTALADARARYSGAVTTDERVKAVNQVESALGRLLAITENYPVLKSSEAVQSLMIENIGTENRVGVARTRFNRSVQDYNLKVKRIPGSIIASITGFEEREYLNISSEAASVPKTTF